MKHFLLATALVTTAICSNTLRAEEEPEKYAALESEKGATHHEVAQYFTGRLMLMNHSTILMSDLAARESSTKEVQQFANQLHKAHAKLNRQLAEAAPKIPAIATLDSAGKPHKAGFRGSPVVERTEAPKEDTEELPRERGELKESFDSPLMHALSIERKATDNYLLESTTMLSHHSGQDFDMGYLGFQIGQHTWMLAELKAMESVEDKQFQKLVSDATKHVKKHLKEARELSKKFADEGDES
ncbi:MAG: DUF4142 domain-containing protein [Fuerstiella sp.]